MKKRLAYLVLAIVMMVAFSSPALAAIGGTIQPYAAVTVSGGITNLSGTYYIWANTTGATESKTVSATLYQQRGTTWYYYDSTSKTASTPMVEASKAVSIGRGYQYKLVCTASSSNSSTSYTYYYDFT